MIDKYQKLIGGDIAQIHILCVNDELIKFMKNDFKGLKQRPKRFKILIDTCVKIIDYENEIKMIHDTCNISWVVRSLFMPV